MKGWRMSPTEEATLIKWLKAELDELKTSLEETRAIVTKMAAEFGQYSQPCKDFEKHMQEHHKREDRWAGFWLKILSYVVTSTLGAVVALLASGQLTVGK